ncbi:MAG: FAD-binding domain-containing protein [Luteolibacter sp.]
MRDWLPRVRAYAARRNFDLGPADRQNVSNLSPFIRHRLVTEEELARAVLERYDYGAVEKFLQEIAWRAYWKGWLEMRPAHWYRYLDELAAIELDPAMERAMMGQTGICCFDEWVNELRCHGSLHNHARMWFASIWIFTLDLPWQLGADFMYRHLIDGDPASNTLSWRWVAGLHTRGKHYLARAENIARYTCDRFNPAGQLREHAPPLVWDAEVSPLPLDLADEVLPDGRVGHLMLADDLAPPPGSVDATMGWYPRESDSIQPRVSELVHSARAEAVEDAVVRASGEFLRGDLADELRAWKVRERLDAIWVARPTVGPWRDCLERLPVDLPLFRFTRSWDRALWPHATAGFFKLRKKLPQFFGSMAPGDLFAGEGY